MVACATYPARVAALVSIAAPAFFDVQNPLQLLTRLGFLVSGRWNKFLARTLAPWSGYWHPPVSQIAVNGYNVTRPVLRRVLANVVENISPGVLRQFGRWIATDTVTDDPETWRDPGTTEDQVAFLQYTSGSTDAPKGVMLSHRNLLHNLALIRLGFGHDDASRGVIWLPPYHDMGLIAGFLMPRRFKKARGFIATASMV